jgi:hypothetical protein
MTTVVPAAVDPAAVDPAVDQAVARLAAEFSDRLRPQLIVRVVRNCRRDLGGSPVGAMPELVERLARHRLSESVS